MNRRTILPPAGYRESHARYLASRGALKVRDQRAMAYLAKKQLERDDTAASMLADAIVMTLVCGCCVALLYLFR